MYVLSFVRFELDSTRSIKLVRSKICEIRIKSLTLMQSFLQDCRCIDEDGLDIYKIDYIRNVF